MQGNMTISQTHTANATMRNLYSKKMMKSQQRSRPIPNRDINDKSISDYNMGGISLNLHGSLPQIKNQLERKKLSMPPITNNKTFKEDNGQINAYYDHNGAFKQTLD